MEYQNSLHSDLCTHLVMCVVNLCGVIDEARTKCIVFVDGANQQLTEFLNGHFAGVRYWVIS